MTPIPVDDPDDSRLAPYRSIRERDLVGRESRFIIEGAVVLDTALRAGRFAVESILLLESRLAGLAAVLARVPAETPVFVAPPAVMDAVAGFPIHRGVLAIGSKRPAESADALLAPLSARALALVLVGVANHDNMGALFRNAAAFGAGAVLLDPSACDPLYRKAIRVGVGAPLLVPFARGESVEELITALDGAGFAHLALSPAGTVPLAAVPHRPRTALWLGAEGPGLPPALLARLPTARIPLAPGWDSLNVATAAGIALHHLAAHRAGPDP